MNLHATDSQLNEDLAGHLLVSEYDGEMYIFEESGRLLTTFSVSCYREARFQVLPAISLSGVLHLDVLTSAWTGEEFRSFIDVLLDNMNTYPGRNSVIIMDNASVHHSDGLRGFVEARYVLKIQIDDINSFRSGMRLVYLPPYSPDLNPIEQGFSSMKAWIRAHNDDAARELPANEGELPACNPYKLIWDAVHESMTPENIRGWFSDSGYLV